MHVAAHNWFVVSRPYMEDLQVCDNDEDAGVHKDDHDS
jgi:hypothetical protein